MVTWWSRCRRQLSLVELNSNCLAMSQLHSPVSHCCSSYVDKCTASYFTSAFCSVSYTNVNSGRLKDVAVEENRVICVQRLFIFCRLMMRRTKLWHQLSLMQRRVLQLHLVWPAHWCTGCVAHYINFKSSLKCSCLTFIRWKVCKICCFSWHCHWQWLILKWTPCLW